MLWTAETQPTPALEAICCAYGLSIRRLEFARYLVRIGRLTDALPADADEPSTPPLVAERAA